MKVHCLFEQSGTFKNEFKKLGYEAYDYDILNEFGQTDYIVDLFENIRWGYENKPSIFDGMSEDDLILAFFPCTSNALDEDRTVENYKELLKECYEVLPSVNPQEPKYCDRNICVSNEYNGIGCDECEVTKSQNLQKSEEVQPKQINDSCLDFDFDKVKEILKKDSLDNLIVDHTCEEKQEQTRDEKMIDAIDFAIKATDSQDDYGIGMRNGMRYVKSLIDGKEPQYELRHTDEEIKLGINLGDEVVGSYGVKGVVVGTDTYNGEVLLSLLMGNHKVPQLVKASRYKTKTGRHFPQIIEVLEQIKEDKE